MIRMVISLSRLLVRAGMFNALLHSLIERSRNRTGELRKGQRIG